MPMAPAAKRGGRPRSPTLSDAGMILPAFDASDSHSTSPPPYVERPPSPSALFSHHSLSPPGSAHSSPSTLRNMSTAEPATHDAPQNSTGTDAWADFDHDPRRASIASTMLSEDFENWPGFDEANRYRDGHSSPPNPHAADDTDLEQDDDDDSDPHSSAALSRRAEIILANAKKRLNVMEGNLRGARESLVVSPTHSGPRSTSELSHHIATTRDRDRRLYAGIGPIPPRTPAYRTSLLYPNGSPGHTRGLSETSVQLPFTPSYLSRSASNKRASSAMGGATSGPWSPESFGNGRFPIKESVSFDSMRERSGWGSSTRDVPTRTASRSSRSPPGLATLPEDGDGPKLHRSASATVGLRDQMNDLKGRISNLKLRAQEEQLRRRSMQSLRTPSPFTSADAGWNAAKSGARENAGLGISATSPTRDVIYEDEQNGTLTPDSTASQREGEALLANGANHQNYNDVLDDEDTSFEEDQSAEEDEASDFVSTNGDDIEVGGDSVYEDAVYEMPVTERHEDRIDAFDYEHFFLHSAMGTYGIQERRGSTSSASSTATTRPVTAMQTSEEITDATKRLSIHQRNPSVDSISTVASFATAAENHSDDEEDESNEQMDQFSQQLLASQQRPSLVSLRSDSAINMRRGNALSPTQTALSRGSSRGSSSPGELASGLQTSKMFSILTESPRDEPRLALSEEDKQLIYSLAASFQQVCKDLQSPCGEAYERKMWRRRLEAARSILNGEGEEEIEDDQSF